MVIFFSPGHMGGGSSLRIDSHKSTVTKMRCHRDLFGLKFVFYSLPCMLFRNNKKKGKESIE